MRIITGEAEERGPRNAPCFAETASEERPETSGMAPNDTGSGGNQKFTQNPKRRIRYGSYAHWVRDSPEPFLGQLDPTTK